MGRGTKDLVLVAMFTAILAIMAQILIPLPFLPVPITGQTLVLALIAIILPKKLATSSMVFIRIIDKRNTRGGRVL